MNRPAGVAAGPNGIVYIADTGNHRIRKIDSAGIITAFAGSDQYKSQGDGGSATIASLNGPFGVAVDSSGNFFIADNYNHRVRKVTAGGVITAFAGDGTFGTFAAQGSPTAVSIDPWGVAIDNSGNLYVADNFSVSVRKITADGTAMTTVAGGHVGYFGDNGLATSAGFFSVQDVAVDGSGNLYIVDTLNQRIRRVSSSGTITTFAGTGVAASFGDGGPATNAALFFPQAVAVDKAGNVYIADGGGNRIRKVDSAGTITTVAGGGNSSPGNGGPALSAQLNFPQGVAVDQAGNIYIADNGSGFGIRKVDTFGAITAVVAALPALPGGDGPPFPQNVFPPSEGIAVDGSGNLYISDTSNDIVRKLTFPPNPSVSVNQAAGQSDPTMPQTEQGWCFRFQLRRPM